MSWLRRRTRTTERREASSPRLAHLGGGALSRAHALHSLAAAIVLTLPFGIAARAQTPRYAFSVVANVVTSQRDEPAAQRLIDAIGLDPQSAFLVYDGNLKGSREVCSDSLYEQRHAMLDASRTPLVFVPGQQDWVSCGASGSGAYEPLERLDLLRQTFFSDPTMLGQSTLAVTRESEVPRFRPYRENVRWQFGDTVFVAMNVPDGNNHFLNAGGRNGEFEDRVIANGFWLEHAAEYAKRRNARAIVIFIQANPLPEREERADRFAWLRFGHRTRDGYLEFRKSLIKLAETFRGPVVLVHTADTKLAHGFVIDQPLRNEKGVRVANVTRIAFALHDPLTQWLQFDVDTTRRTPLRVSVHDVPKHSPLLPPPSLDSKASTPQPEMPEVSSMPDVTEIPGMQQVPGVLPESGATPANGEVSPPTPPAPGAVPNSEPSVRQAP
ncbi:hypothetical protein [Paraburkholderia dinghuensis]|uniref:Uncharacterized protein n=1 Tax=Paraburkholderia dinghuensis TaxID=2305225 RepID=A0A3N6N9X3_9BURK|nr:hypothetical protein [Paraburkholderia dinghuensis]RQH07861.1 hypothetical protein D1Y85_07050 [Paraburkholderia dinghuensis]